MTTCSKQFYQQLPPFTQIEFNELNQLILSQLRNRKRLESLAADGSKTAIEFLATACWQHPHDANEEFAFQSLEKAGADTSPLLRDLIRHARSTCTIRSAGHILARRKDPQALLLLLPKVYEDLRTVYEMNIAGALDTLGDPRAIPALTTMMAADDLTSGPVSLLQDRLAARARATLALGAFDSPNATRTLVAATQNPRLAPYAHAVR